MSLIRNLSIFLLLVSTAQTLINISRASKHNT